jgi:carboxylesterase
MFLLGLIGVWLVGDFIYSQVIASRLQGWEAQLEFDRDGVRKGCAAYEIGSGPHALLLIHGFNDSPACYYKLAPELASRGYTVRTLRLPGFGGTTADYATVDHSDWLAAIDESVRDLRSHHTQVSMVAHSLGGALAIRHCAAHPGSVDSLTLLAPAIAVNNQRSPFLSAQTWHQVASRVLLFTKVVENIYPLDGHSSEARNYPYAHRFVPQRATTEFFAVVDGVESLASEIEVPLLVVVTREDLIVDWQAAQRFYDAAASHNKRIEFIDDAGHLMPFDHGWDRIANWIDQLAQGHSDQGS